MNKLTPEGKSFIKKEAVEQYYADDLRQDAFITGATTALEHPEILKAQGLYTLEELKPKFEDAFKSGIRYALEQMMDKNVSEKFSQSPPKTEV